MKPKKLHCSECGSNVFSASPEDELAGVMCLECSGDNMSFEEREEQVNGNLAPSNVVGYDE